VFVEMPLIRHFHVKRRDPRQHFAPKFVHSNVTSRGLGGLCIQQMEGIIREFLAGIDRGSLPHHTVTFERGNFPSIVGHHPFASFDRHGMIAAVMNRNNVNEAVRTVGRSSCFRIVNDAIYRDAQAFWLQKSLS